MKYFAILFMLFSIACSNNKKITKSTNSPINQQEQISLSRTACFGTCPIYDVSIQSNGKVLYNGKAYVENIGKFEGQISISKANALFQKINAFNWKSYPDRFPIDNVDFPQYTLTYISPNVNKEVACNSNATKELIALSIEIDTLIKEIELNKINE